MGLFKVIQKHLNTMSHGILENNLRKVNRHIFTRTLMRPFINLLEMEVFRKMIYKQLHKRKFIWCINEMLEDWNHPDDFLNTTLYPTEDNVELNAFYPFDWFEDNNRELYYGNDDITLTSTGSALDVVNRGVEQHRTNDDSVAGSSINRELSSFVRHAEIEYIDFDPRQPYGVSLQRPLEISYEENQPNRNITIETDIGAIELDEDLQNS